MAIQTADSFYAMLEKSQLLSDKQLAEAREEVEDDDSKSAARRLVRNELLTRWQAGQLLAGRSSFFLGKYKLIDLLGHGGMGRVFLGEHTTMNRRVALKILPRRIGRDPAARQRFLAEARAVAALDHPNIVQAYSVDNEGDRFYLVMEYVDGGDLEEKVQADGPLEFATAADYIAQAAEGLDHGHERGLVHRDIKPSNLLVNKQGVVKLVDLGLARAAGRDDDDGSSDERVIGTVDYMAPEQGLESSDCDHRADIYSLGCTFYFLLTGRPPFPGGTLHQRILKHQTQEATPIEELRPGVPEELVAICRQMMAKDPDERFQSAKEVSELLAPWRPARRSGSSSGLGLLKVAEPLADGPDTGFPGIVVGGASAATATAPAFAKSPAPKTAETQTQPAADSGEKVALLGTPARKLIAGGIALFVLAGLVTAATLPFVLGGDEADEQQAAQSQPEAPPGPVAVEVDEEDDLEALDNLEGDTTGGEQSAGEPEPGGETPGEPAASPSDGTDSETPGTGEQPATESDPSATEPGEPSSEPTPADPESKDPPPKDDAPKEPAEKPLQKQPPKKPPEKKPPPKPADPFRELAKNVELPEPGPSTGAAGPFSLGKLHLPENAALTMELLGGDAFLRGDRQFAMQSGNANTWTISFNDAARSGQPSQPTEVASIDLNEESKALEFRWVDGASTLPPVYARALRNCGLKLSVGQKSKLLPLASPQHVEPLDVDFKKGTVRTNLPIDNPPDPESLRIHLTKIEGDVPKNRFEPQGGIGGEDGVRIVFPSDGTLPTYGLLVKLLTTGSSARVEVSAFVRMDQQPAAAGGHGAAPAPPAAGANAGPPKELPLTMRTLQQALAQHSATKRMIEGRYGNASQIQKSKRLTKEAKALFTSQLEAADVALGQLQALGLQCQKLQETGKIHFEVFAEVGDQRLHLVDTKTPMPEMGPLDAPGEDGDFELDLGDDDEDGGGGGGKDTFF